MFSSRSAQRFKIFYTFNLKKSFISDHIVARMVLTSHPDNLTVQAEQLWRLPPFIFVGRTTGNEFPELMRRDAEGILEFAVVGAYDSETGFLCTGSDAP